MITIPKDPGINAWLDILKGSEIWPFARELFEVITSEGDLFVPEYFRKEIGGRWVPFDPQDLSAPLSAWEKQKGYGFADLLRKKPFRVEMNAGISGFRFWASPKLLSRVPAQRLVSFLERVASIFNPVYGFVDTGDNLQEQLFFVDPVSGSTFSRGAKIRNGLYGVFWINIFGPEYVQLISRERLQTCPSLCSRPFGSGWIIIATEKPPVWQGDSMPPEYQAIKDHLGHDLFADMFTGEKAARIPDFPPLPDPVATGVAPPPPTKEELEAAQLAIDKLDFLIESLREELSQVGIELEFSREGLLKVEQYILSLRKTKKKREHPDGLPYPMGAAAFFGELVRRDFGGSWRVCPSMGQAMVAEIGNGDPRLRGPFGSHDWLYPYQRVYKLWVEGKNTTLVGLYDSWAYALGRGPQGSDSSQGSPEP